MKENIDEKEEYEGKSSIDVDEIYNLPGLYKPIKYRIVTNGLGQFSIEKKVYRVTVGAGYKFGYYVSCHWIPMPKINFEFVKNPPNDHFCQNNREIYTTEQAAHDALDLIFNIERAEWVPIYERKNTL